MQARLSAASPTAPVVPTVSVALCVYNGERFLEHQVDSLFRQTRLPDEIVAIDDASSDGSFALLQALAARSPVPMQVHRNAQNLGYRRNFERAIAATRGDIVFLADQDDDWAPEKTARCLAAFEDPRVMLVHSDAHLVDAELRPLDVTLFESLGVTDTERRLEDDGHAFDVLLKRNIVTGATTAVRRVVFDRALPFPDEWVHDEWLAVVAALMGRLARIDAPLVSYRQHGRNQIGARPRSVADKLRTLAGNDGGYQQRQWRRMQRLHQRIDGLLDAAQPRISRLLQYTLRHNAVRAALPAEHWRRLAGIAGELLNLGYFRYSRGWISVVRDLLGPIDAQAALQDARSCTTSPR